ncbi:MAG TPA: SpoIID/LytB domain-containing protein [Bacteroidales bacterium]|nr:SpoIID/LytB domain-containing protein [Bacteroidales bacterium]
MLIRILKVTILIILLQVSLKVDGQVRVRLFRGLNMDGFILNIVRGEYEIYGNGNKRATLAEGGMIYIAVAGEKIAVTSRDSDGFIASNISLTDISEEGIFSIKPLPGNKDIFEYEGSLDCSYELENLFLINEIGIERYVAAVVQAEGGFKGHPEYFKTQAIITRTYTNLHIDRHFDDGYNLCDDVHCQVYKGRSVTPIIDEAVNATAGLVVTGPDSILILTPFHSNCGGETVPSDRVWLTGLPYLQAVTDPYCLYSKNATWESEINLSDWKQYLVKNGYNGNGNSGSLNFLQNSRKENYVAANFQYPLENIRDDFSLRSTFFSVEVTADKVQLKGRGYGHGVGLCQEGAMVMGSRGFSYSQIIGFYYAGVSIINISFAKSGEKIVKSF